VVGGLKRGRDRKGEGQHKHTTHLPGFLGVQHRPRMDASCLLLCSLVLVLLYACVELMCGPRDDRLLCVPCAEES